MRKLLTSLALVFAFAVSASAQITVPHTLTDGETIDAARLNANFAMFADALNRTGGTLTGAITTVTLAPTGNNASDVGSSSLAYRTLYLQTSLVLSDGTEAYTITWANAAANRALTIPDPGGADSFAFLAATQTLTNKTFDLTSNTLVSTSAQLAGALTNETGSGAAVFATSPSIVTPSLSSPALDGVVTNVGLYTSAGSQPGFLAYNSADDSVSGASGTVEFDTEVYDEGADYDNTTDTFTAPTTGKYLLCTQVTMVYDAVNVSPFIITIDTSNRDYTWVVVGDIDALATNHTAGGCVIADMDTGDTAKVLRVSGANMTIENDANLGNTYFSGRLLP